MNGKHLRLLGLVSMGLACAAALGDAYLVRRIELGAHFGVLGNNPFTLATDGTHAYVGGYSASATPREIGILKISLDDPVGDAGALGNSTQTVNQFRYYGGIVVQGGVAYALCDRPDGTYPGINIRAINTATGQLVTTWGGDGIVEQPAGLTTTPALGGLAYDPGFGGVDYGVSLLAYGSGRRILFDDLGLPWYDTSDGMIVADNDTMGCTVTDKTAWRDHVYDAAGNVYMRRSNQVQVALRSGSNSISGYAHLTDELDPNGLPLVGCGDGKPVPTRRASGIIGQHLAFIPAASALTDEDLIVFNDRWSTFSLADRTFADAVKVITTSGALPTGGFDFVDGDGGPLSTSFDIAPGFGLYDFYYDAARDELLVLDFTHRNLLVFAGTPPCHDPVPGDIDAFAGCMAGPALDWYGPPADQEFCACADAGNDNDVDVIDWAILQVALQ